MEVKPGYKQTEVGVIPEDWAVRPLMSALRIAQGQVDPRNEPYRSMVLVAPDHIESGTGRLMQRQTAADQAAISGKYLFAARDVIYSKIRPHLRKATLATFDGLCSADMYPLRSAADISPGYLLNVILGERFSRYAESVSVRSGMPKINRQEMAGFSLAVPPLPEQQAVAQALSDVDDLIQSLERLIAKKRGLKQAAMQQLLSGQTRLPGFKAAWEETHVRSVIADYFSGPSPTCEERNISDEEEWGVLKTTAATKERGWNWKAHKTLPRVFWNDSRRELREGDVIVTKAGPRHRVGVTARVDFIPPRIIPSGKMIALRPHPDRAEPLMLAAAISAKATQKFLDDRTTGMAESQVNFENDSLLQAPIVMPAMSEQKAIAEVLSDMDAEIEALEARLAKTRDLKQGMMQELLTGRTRLV